MKYDNLILFDWFSFTAKHLDEVGIVWLLGLDISLFETTFGVRGYKHRLYYDGININYGGEGKEEVWCEMSGKGCRAFESFGHGRWNLLFDEVLSCKDYNITRLDVAFDDHVGMFDLRKLASYVHKKHIVSDFRKHGVIYDYQGDQEAITIYHGSPKSDVYFRIYDKAIERNREDEGHWVRFEIQMRDNHAHNFLNLMVMQNVGEVFAKTINRYLRYVEPSSDSNKRRWPMADFWSNFIVVSEKLSLYRAPGTEYNFDALERYVVDQAGAATAAYVKFIGVDAFIEKCMIKLSLTRNPKYGELLERYQRLEIEQGRGAAH